MSADEEYIERDYVGFGQRERLTHYPSVDTLLRQPYMLLDRWLLLKVQWLAKYPGVRIQDERGNILEREELTR
jgi:hypothetical protein